MRNETSSAKATSSGVAAVAVRWQPSPPTRETATPAETCSPLPPPPTCASGGTLTAAAAAVAAACGGSIVAAAPAAAAPPTAARARGR